MQQRSSNELVVRRNGLGVAAMSGRLTRFLPACLAFVVMVGAIFNGLDNSYGSAVLCLLLSTTALLCIVSTPIELRSLRQFMLATLPLSAAAVWALTVSVGGFGPALVPDLALSEALGLASVGLALFCGTLLGRNRPARLSTQQWLIGCGAIVTALSCLAPIMHEELAIQFWPSGQNGRFAGTFGNANVAGTFFATLATLTLASILATKEPRRPGYLAPRIDWLMVARWIVLLMTVAACAATASRTAIGSAVLAMAALLAIRLFKSTSGKRRPSYLLVALAIGGTLLLLIGAEELQYRFGSFSGDFSVRQMMWSHYASIASASPLTGYGLGSFPTVNARFLGSADIAQELWSVNAAHNLAVQLVIDAGLPYLLLVAFFVARVCRDVLRALRIRHSILEWGQLLAAGVILTNAMVDIVLEIPMMIILFWTLLGLIWGRALSVEIRRAELSPPEHKGHVGVAAAH